jgi:hypothetical protein
MKRRYDREFSEKLRRDTFATLRERFDRLLQVLTVSYDHQSTATAMISQMTDLAIVASGQRARQFEDVKLKLYVLNVFLGNDSFDIEANLAISIADDIKYLVPQFLSPTPRPKRKVVLKPAPVLPEHQRPPDHGNLGVREHSQELAKHTDNEIAQVL